MNFSCNQLVVVNICAIFVPVESLHKLLSS